MERFTPFGRHDDPVDVSVIIPLYNEEENVEALYRELDAALRHADERDTDIAQIHHHTYEILFIDDGSTDRTLERLQAVVANDPAVRIIRFRRNFGQTAALSAGFDYARGDILVPLDGDLQNDPADIPRLLEKIDEGYDVVSGWRTRRQDPFLRRRLPSIVANRLISWISGVHLHDYGCTLKAYRRDAMTEVRLYGEMHRFIPIHVSWYGGRIAELEVNHRPRKGGRSKYGLDRTVKVVLDLIVIAFLSHYARKPIYVFGGFGLLMFVLAFLTGCWGLYIKYLADPPTMLNRTPIPAMVAGMAIVGFLAIFMGLLAEMNTRIYYESQRKPIYSVREVIEPKSNAEARP
jgi:glycosyltransferase involved in cell wall biosynthesis